ncbi:MAG: chondroitinase-B domain-containing protein [Bacteroidota bacterium]
MHILTLKGTLFLIAFLSIFSLKANTFFVNSQLTFNSAQNAAGPNDTIIWRSGTFSNIFMDIDKDRLFITAETLGGTVFNGASRVDITGDYITLQGFQFVGGDIGTRDVINTRGSYNVFTQINIRAYTCYKYLRVREESQYVDITYCNFENRLNQADQNILSILVDANQPGYHKIQHCSFKNFAGMGNDEGVEPIRIGLSTQADRISRTVVEYCYFTQCNGDGELISSKATQNVYRYNTFEDNPVAELVLRHGSQAIVYSNFFLSGKGGVRVREGQNHYIYNNYFYDLDDRAIYLQNASSDPLSDINIAFNTIYDCDEVILGGDGSFKPTNVTLANNIFANPNDDLFEDATGTETWIGNIAFGDLGIPLPTEGLTITDPKLMANSEGFYGLTADSPAIDTAEAGYALLPNFMGITGIDTSLLFDLMGQDRPTVIKDKDLGANEFPHNIPIQPIATEANTGPDYNTSVLTNTSSNVRLVEDLIKISPNPVVDQLRLTLYSAQPSEIRVDIYNLEGRLVQHVLRNSNFSGEMTFADNIENLPDGIYTIHAKARDLKSGMDYIQTLKFVKP